MGQLGSVKYENNAYIPLYAIKQYGPLERDKQHSVNMHQIITPRAHARARGYVIGRGVHTV